MKIGEFLLWIAGVILMLLVPLPVLLGSHWVKHLDINAPFFYTGCSLASGCLCTVSIIAFCNADATRNQRVTVRQ